jgi:hypothetical protein
MKKKTGWPGSYTSLSGVQFSAQTDKAELPDHRGFEAAFLPEKRKSLASSGLVL